MSNNIEPTKEQFGAYRDAFQYFNKRLFQNRLPEIILNFSRRAKAYGFFAPERWNRDGILTHEISLNPSMMERTPLELYSTLVHEMCHLEHHENGDHQSKKGYHNKEWGGMMKAVGLHPSNTGQPGGSETGFRMTHYIVEDGPFAKAFAEIPKEFLLPWGCAPEQSKTVAAPKKRAKYHCAACDYNVYSSKDGLVISCDTCKHPLIEGDRAKESEKEPEAPKKDA
jgi:predicted SprT family Zn-dependent metalloprotease